MCAFFSVMAAKKRVRYAIDMVLTSEEERIRFKQRLDDVKALLSPAGGPKLDNLQFVLELLKLAEGQARELPAAPQTVPQTGSFLQKAGMFCGNCEDDLFVSEKGCLSELCAGLVSPCPCSTNSQWLFSSAVQKGHVLRLKFQCSQCRNTRTWASSRVISGHYMVNQKLVHAFTAAGVLPSQYTHFSQFAGIGSVSYWYMSKVYKRLGYIDAVAVVAEKSMRHAIELVECTADYERLGEWVITDARHDSTANAFHTTVPCLSGSNKRIVGISTVPRREHHTAQTRELVATKHVLPQVIGRGLHVTEVAHDFQTQVTAYVKGKHDGKLELVNSYDTWHGTKNVAKQLKTLCQGAKKNEGKTWFAQLADKRKSIKTSVYWAMKNCGECPKTLQDLITNISKHYQGNHSGCHKKSPCHSSTHMTTKAILTDPLAIQALEKHLRSVNVFKHAESYCRCRDTYWVESFNHQLLTYLPKRIHFGTTTFCMRMNLALCDWNENCQRDATSSRMVLDMRRPDRRTPMKVLVPKTFHFVDSIWWHYMERNLVDVRPLEETEEGDGDDSDLEDDGGHLDDDDDSDNDDNNDD